jgi:hypothetical protein
VSNGDTKQRVMKGAAQRPSDRGALSFGYFSLCTQRKATRPFRAKPTPKKIAPTGAIFKQSTKIKISRDPESSSTAPTASDAAAS